MLKIARYYALLCFSALVCVSARVQASTSEIDYTAFRQSQPASILVLPPINNSIDVRAGYSFLATVTRPLTEAGYYIFPVAVVDQTFKENGLQQPDDMHNTSLDKLREIFGADAALYITVEEYGAKYKVVKSNVVVAAKAKLIDTRSGQLLWQGSAKAANDEGQGSLSDGLVGMLVEALVTQVLNNLGDSGYDVAKKTSWRLFHTGNNGLLPGPRSRQYVPQQ